MEDDEAEVADDIATDDLVTVDVIADYATDWVTADDKVGKT